jgi:hypothetical protein
MIDEAGSTPRHVWFLSPRISYTSPNPITHQCMTPKNKLWAVIAALTQAVAVILTAQATNTSFASVDPKKAEVVELNQKSLDGTWSIVPDYGDTGLRLEWWRVANFPAQQAKAIEVPGNTYEALPDYNGVAWYLRSFDLTAAPAAGRRSFLRFGAVQYLCRVWLNGQEVGGHEGAEGPFELEVTGKLVAGTNAVILRVENPPGHLFGKGGGDVPVGIYDMGGILGRVYLAEQPRLRIADVYAKPDPATGDIAVEVTCDNAGEPATVNLRAVVSERKSRNEQARANLSILVPAGKSIQQLTLQVKSPRKWDLDDPFLYSVEVRAAAHGEEDLHRIERLGFRDFRLVNGFFTLNGRRIFLKSTHTARYDPVLTQGVARDMTWLGRDAAKLKAAGFNALRSINTAFMPEQLAIADEVGLLLYSEHAAAWYLRDKSKFRVELLDLVRRDRHHPSLVIWGLLNETTRRPGPTEGIYETARETLPLIREVDDSRVIILSSGRWDRDWVTGSASNPGAKTWDVLLGGEGPTPTYFGTLPGARDKRLTIGISGDIHVYQPYPTSWIFINGLRTHGSAAPNPIFLSENGVTGVVDPYTEQRKLTEAKAPPSAFAWKRVHRVIANFERRWKDYGLGEVYPEIPAMIADSHRNAAKERDLTNRAIRANPRFNGYSQTAMMDHGGTGVEGIWDNFREWKPGFQEAITSGWAPTRFSLLVNPTPITSGKPFRLIAALADEDRLPAGPHRVTLSVRDQAGVVRWSNTYPLTLGEPGTRPLAVTVSEEDVPALPLAEGRVSIEAALEGGPALPGSRLDVPVYEAARHSRLKGPVQVIGLTAQAQALLTSCGGSVEEYDPAAATNRLAIVCGPDLPAGWDAQSWRRLYAQVARGAHLVVIGPNVLHGVSGPTHFLPIPVRGEMHYFDESWRHREFIAKPGPVFEGLPTGLLTGETYNPLLTGVLAISGASAPEANLAVAINWDGSSSEFVGPFIATWRHGAGRITVCTLDVIPQIGLPVADRLLVNLARYAQAGSEDLQPLPPDYAAQLDQLGIVDSR